MAKTPVKSPCVLVCAVDGATGFCFGCLRTLAEIARWGSFEEEERAAVLARLEERKAMIPLDRLGLFGLKRPDS